MFVATHGATLTDQSGAALGSSPCPGDTSKLSVDMRWLASVHVTATYT